MRCKLCLSTNVHRSWLHEAALRAHPLQSPYRCQDCDSRYWVVSRAARLTVIAGLCVGMAVALAAGPSLLEVREVRSSPRLDWVGNPQREGLARAVYVATPEASSAWPEDPRGTLPLSWPVQSLPGPERMD